MNPYDVLGIQKDASQADIKLRFKILSQRYHPDKCKGDSTLYDEIRMAYEMLKAQKPIDPEETLQMAGMTILGQVFSHMISIDIEGDIIATARQAIGVERNNIQKQRKQLLVEQQILHNNRKRVTVRSAATENLFVGLIDKKITDNQEKIKSLDEGLQYRDKALSMLDDYDDIAPQTRRSSFTIQDMTNALNRAQTSGTFFRP